MNTARFDRRTGTSGPRAFGEFSPAKLLAAAIWILGLGTGSVAANPIPPFVMHTHVHHDDGSLCDAQGMNPLPIWSCSQIVQDTPELGVLAFDFIVAGFIESFVGDGGTHQITIGWPSGWQFVRAEACGDGSVVAHQTNAVTFFIRNADTAPQTPWGLLSWGRLVLNATSPGQVPRTGGSMYFSPARVGQACDPCGPPHCYYDYCPILARPTLALAAQSGGEADGRVEVNNYTYGTEYQHEFEFAATTPWMAVEAHPMGASCCPAYEVSVHADASDLPDGIYQGEVQVRSPWCDSPIAVTLTVGDIPQPVMPETWGRIKARFR